MKRGRPKGTIKVTDEQRTISIRVPLPLWRKVEKAAHGEGRKISGYVRRVLQRTLEPEKTSGEY